MSGTSLRAALAAIRRLSPPAVATVATPGSGSGDSQGMGKTQAPQGFAEGVATVSSVSIENVAPCKFPPSTPAEAAALRECLNSVATGGDGDDSQDLRGFRLSPPPQAPVATVATAPLWTNLDRWCARLGAAGGLHARRAVLRAWVDATGGWHDAAAVHLPATLPKGLAAATLRAHARALRLDVRDDPDDPAHLRWLRGERP